MLHNMASKKRWCSKYVIKSSIQGLAHSYEKYVTRAEWRILCDFRCKIAGDAIVKKSSIPKELLMF